MTAIAPETIEFNPNFKAIRWDSEGDYRFVLEGCEIPNIAGYLMADGSWSLTLDHRFSCGAIPADELSDRLWFLANAMAVAAGFTSFGRYSNPINPYRTVEGPGTPTALDEAIDQRVDELFKKAGL